MKDGPCRVFTSDLGVRVVATGLATYPDASVVCGATERDAEKKTNITNPRVLLEVTSESTEDYDRGEKLEPYKQAPTLECIIIVSDREAHVEVWSRVPLTSEWKQSEARAGQRARVECLSCDIDVDALHSAAAERR